MNFLIIQTDQERRDMGSVYGGPARTPALERLASEGVVFDYAFTPIPICGPARASLITGLRPGRHGILFNKECGTVAGRDFVDRPATLAEILARRGYRSTLCGKWHVGTELTPADCGFEGVLHPGYGYPSEHPDYLAYLRRLGAEFRLQEEFYGRMPDGSRGPLLCAVQDGPDRVGVPFYLADQAVAAMRHAAARREPFLVRCDFWGPHEPCIIPERFARMYAPAALLPWSNFEDDLANKPRVHRVMRRYYGVDAFTWDDWARIIAMYCGYVAMIDEAIGEMLYMLDSEGLAANTAVFYTADHGGMLGAHGMEDKGPFLYDEIVRIPMAARIPGAPGGRRSDALVYNMDIMPTVLELAGCEVPAGLDAVSLIPLLVGQGARVREDEAVWAEFHGHQAPYTQRMLRTRTTKYVFNPADIDELYDLESDPGELHNLVAEPNQTGLLREMRGRMLDRFKKIDDPLLKFFQAERMHGHSPVADGSAGEEPL